MDECNTRPAVVDEWNTRPAVVDEWNTRPAVVDEWNTRPVVVDEWTTRPSVVDERVFGLGIPFPLNRFTHGFVPNGFYHVVYYCGGF